MFYKETVYGSPQTAKSWCSVKRWHKGDPQMNRDGKSAPEALGTDGAAQPCVSSCSWHGPSASSEARTASASQLNERVLAPWRPPPACPTTWSDSHRTLPTKQRGFEQAVQLLLVMNEQVALAMLVTGLRVSPLHVELLHFCQHGFGFDDSSGSAVAVAVAITISVSAVTGAVAVAVSTATAVPTDAVSTTTAVAVPTAIAVPTTIPTPTARGAD